jgi:kumamolisin
MKPEAKRATIRGSDNGAFSSSKRYSAGPGWDACTGWGSPNGTELLKALGG